MHILNPTLFILKKKNLRALEAATFATAASALPAGCVAEAEAAEVEPPILADPHLLFFFVASFFFSLCMGDRSVG